MSAHRRLDWGEPAPWFIARTPLRSDFVFHTLAGRFVVLSFIGTSDAPQSRKFIEAIAGAALPYDDRRFVCFGVTAAESDLADERMHQAFIRDRIFFDPGCEIAAQFGLVNESDSSRDAILTARWFILDRALRVYAQGTLDHSAHLISTLRNLPDPESTAAGEGDSWAPVLLVPRVLNAEFCTELIDIYSRGERYVSGFMRNRDGRTVRVEDPSFKQRNDVAIEDENVRERLCTALFYRLVPEIQKAFQFNVTRIERYIVACYSGEDQGFFKRHRDNTAPATAHRRLAVTINLNAGDYEGGELCFPEFGNRLYTAPTGGAIVFSCSLLHEARPVRVGKRYATLPFLYDDEAAKIREKNIHLLGDGSARYKA